MNFLLDPPNVFLLGILELKKDISVIFLPLVNIVSVDVKFLELVPYVSSLHPVTASETIPLSLSVPLHSPLPTPASNDSLLIHW